MYRFVRMLGCIVVAAALVAPLAPAHAAAAFADPQFASQWQAGEAITPNFWGPLANARPGQQEAYGGTTRLVQYFDKGRMEITGGKVTNGLLATEMITGQVQTGDATFESRPPPAIQIAGDADGNGPTYAYLAGQSALLSPAPSRIGQPFTTVIVEGRTVTIAPTNPAAVATTVYDAATQHNVFRLFADYRSRAGIAAVGLAISEPFYAEAKIAGAKKSIAVQVFERRVLTFNGDNPEAFQVEMGNIGQHYYQWRYTGAGIAAPPAATAAPTVAAAPPTATPRPATTNPPVGGAGGSGVVVSNGGSCPPGYPVKANANSGIYHVPGQRFYTETNANNCYAASAGAEAAGYRASKV